jgi:hypothetical protein
MFCINLKKDFSEFSFSEAVSVFDLNSVLVAFHRYGQAHGFQQWVPRKEFRLVPGRR